MSGKGSKFGFLKSALQDQEVEASEEAHDDELKPAVEEVPPSPAPPAAQAVKPTSRLKANPRVQTSETARGPGRPNGKRSDGQHVQVTAYIRKDTRSRVRKILVNDEDGPDFSELVEELLAKWLKSRT